MGKRKKERRKEKLIVFSYDQSAKKSEVDYKIISKYIGKKQ